MGYERFNKAPYDASTLSFIHRSGATTLYHTHLYILCAHKLRHSRTLDHSSSHLPTLQGLPKAHHCDDAISPLAKKFGICTPYTNPPSTEVGEHRHTAGSRSSNDIRRHVRTNARTHTDSQTEAPKHVHRHTHKLHTHTNTRTHAHTQTPTHPHTYAHRTAAPVTALPIGSTESTALRIHLVLTSTTHILSRC